MVKLPNWKELKNRLEDPQQREELREKVQRGVDQGRESAAKRLAGPAAHLKNVGSQFKAGINQAEPSGPPGSAQPPAPAGPIDPPAPPAPEQ